MPLQIGLINNKILLALILVDVNHMWYILLYIQGIENKWWDAFGTQQTQDVNWPNHVDFRLAVGPAANQHWVNVF